MQANGILLVGMESVSDNFMTDVAKTLHQIFPQDTNLNLTKQHEILNTMLQYSTAIPNFSCFPKKTPILEFSLD